MFSRIRCVEYLLLSLALLLPAASAIDLYGGPGAQTSGYGDAGGGVYTIDEPRLGYDRYIEVGIEAWAKTEGNGEAESAYYGAENKYKNYEPWGYAYGELYSLDAYYRDAAVKAGVLGTGDDVTLGAYSAIYANAWVEDGYNWTDWKNRTLSPTDQGVGGSATIVSILGDYTTRDGTEWTGGFDGCGEGYAIADGIAGYDTRFKKGCCYEDGLNAYGQVEGTTGLYAESDCINCVVSGSAIIETESETWTNQSDDGDVWSYTYSEMYIDTSARDGTSYISAHADGLAYSGTWDFDTPWDIPHIHGFENLYSEVDGIMYGRSITNAMCGSGDEAESWADLFSEAERDNQDVYVKGWLSTSAWVNRTVTRDDPVWADAYIDDADFESWAMLKPTGRQVYQSATTDRGMASGAHMTNMTNMANGVGSWIEYWQWADSDTPDYDPEMETWFDVDSVGPEYDPNIVGNDNAVGSYGEVLDAYVESVQSPVGLYPNVVSTYIADQWDQHWITANDPDNTNHQSTYMSGAVFTKPGALPGTVVDWTNPAGGRNYDRDYRTDNDRGY